MGEIEQVNFLYNPKIYIHIKIFWFTLSYKQTITIKLVGLPISRALTLDPQARLGDLLKLIQINDSKKYSEMLNILLDHIETKIL